MNEKVNENLSLQRTMLAVIYFLFVLFFYIYIYFCQMKLGSEVYYRISNNKEVILEIKINYLKSYCNCSPRDCRQILLLILGEYKQINYSS